MSKINVLKKLLKVSIIFNIITIFIVVMGGTACFKRKMDLIQTTILIFTGVPTIVSLICSNIIILMSRKYNNKSILFFLYLFIVVHICISIFGIINTNKVGWIEDRRISMENFHLTDDNKYEYCIEKNINYLFNYKYLSLCIENKTNNERFCIKVSNNIEYNEEDKTNNDEYFGFYSKLSKTNIPDIYYLDFIKNISQEYSINKVMIDLRNRTLKNVN